jgi:molecular chaperone GrpE (heat shock protein)
VTTPNVETDPEKIAENAASKAPDRTRTKPLGITEKKQIEKYINSDYDLLIADLKQYRTELVRARTMEINEQFAAVEGQANAVMEAWVEVRDQCREAFRAWQDNATQQGFTIKRDRFNNLLEMNRPAITIEGKERALREVEQEVDYVISRAKHALERKRGETLRALIMSGGVPEEAKALVEGLPSAQDVLLAAMQERPGATRLLLGAAMQQQQGQVIVQQDEDTVEGLVIHDATDYRQGVQQ